MFRVYLFSLLAVFFVLPLSVDALGTDAQEVVVRQQIGADTTPPTQPGFISAVPVATNQIDVSWGSSTDDFQLGGYRLFRDGSHLATTSLLTYSDTGLAASTTYSYSVQAFDWEFRLSTTTGPVATTTFEITVTPTSTPTTTSSSGGGGGRQLKLNSLVIDTTIDSAAFEWETNLYSRYILKWGISSSYEDGFVQSDIYSKEHYTLISDLLAETEYFYQLVGYDNSDREYILSEDSFFTVALPDETAPPNVTNFRAVVDSTNVFLSWDNPDAADFSKVRMVRSHIFYPESPTDGFIVYEGKGESVLDGDALLDYEQQYYTIFAYDAVGNVSSGAIVSVDREGVVVIPIDVPVEPEEPSDPDVSDGDDDSDSSGSGSNGSGDNNDNDDDTDDGSTPSNPGGDDDTGPGISFIDIDFWQDNFLLGQQDGLVTVRDDLPLTMRLSADKLPSYIKTLTVVLYDDDEPAGSYILRLNSINTAYEARIDTLDEGTYGVVFALFDFKKEQQYTFGGEVVSTSNESDLLNEPVSVLEDLSPEEKIVVYTLFPGFFLSMFLLWWWLFIIRRGLN